MVQMEQGRKLDLLRDHVMSTDGLEEKVEGRSLASWLQCNSAKMLT